MDFSNIKLVVSDMDGTLLNAESKIGSNFLSIYNQLKKLNIQFVAASGRQYYSIIDRFDKSIQQEITIIAENGAFAMQGNKELFVTELPTNHLIKSIKTLRTLQNVFVVLCGKKSAYIETTNPQFINVFKNYYSEYTIVDDLLNVTDDVFFKIASYHFDCSETYIYPTVKHLENDMQVIVSGAHWLDISHKNANKGFALQALQQQLGCTIHETMAFGDYNNDLKMLERSKLSFAMENAHPNVKKVAKYTTKSNIEEGVELILKQLITARTIE